MNISLAQPIRQSWERTVVLLFRPFVLKQWFILGFAAFLSEGLSRSWGSRYSYRARSPQVPADLANVLHRLAEFLRHPVWGALVLVLLTIACIAALLILWVSCRGRFIFLDNVVHQRIGIVEPWRRFARRGNELFVFTLVSLGLWGAAFLTIALPALPALLEAAASGHWKVALVAIGGVLIVLIPLGMLAAIYFSFLRHFVVPIMYQQNVGPLDASGRFLALFARHPLHFIAFAVVCLVLAVGVFAGVVAVGLATCCIGFALIVTPYIGSVVLLPVEVFFRGLGPDFLAQFGPEYSLFTGTAPETAR